MKPSRSLLGILGLWLALSVIAAAVPSWRWPWGIFGLSILLLASLDWMSSKRETTPEIARQVARTLAVGVYAPVSLRMVNPLSREISCELHDHLPQAFRSEGLPATFKIAAGASSEVTYRARPLERGDHHFDSAEMWIQSVWTLWWKKVRGAGGTTVQVHPNFLEVAKFVLLAAENKLSKTGVRLARRRGTGTEFHELREYRPGDSIRAVDWKATARRARLISREHRDEQDQQIVFLLDCGRRMRTRDGELSHFDHSLNALLLLAYVALRQGDRVGLLTYGGGERSVTPRGGLDQLPDLLKAIYDLQPSLDAVNLSAALEQASGLFRKRTLFVVLTDLGDESDVALRNTANVIRRRHLVLVASLRDRIFRQTLDKPVEDLDSALILSATHQYLELRDRRQAERAAAGLMTLDTEPDKLPSALVNRYLELKASHAL
jgi:uncharacterized protein (DUF58 family)